MKKKILVHVVVVLVMVICAIGLCACGKTNKGLGGNPKFVGRWQCAKNPLEHPDYYTGYLVWAIEEDGSFTMHDAEAGNPGIAGKLEVISEKEIQLNCNTEDDFDPPVTWESMKETQVLKYAFETDKELRVTFAAEEGDSTLVFTKIE